ncbi:MAG: AsmA family protein, partial [Chromatiales bacterium]
MTHPAVKWSLRILAAATLLVVLLFALVLGYLFYGDDTLLPPRLERVATLALDRQVHIEGEVVLEPGLEPRIAVSGLRIDNADWGRAPHLVTLGRVDVAIRLVPLFSGVVEILSIELDDLDVQLERNADGEDNWTLGRQGVPQGPKPTLPLIHLLDFENLSVTYSASGEPARRIVLREAYSKGLGAERFELAAYGDLMGYSFSLLAEGGEVDTLLEQDGEWPLLVKL